MLREPSVIAVDRGSGRVLAVGEPARGMIGRTPRAIAAVRPIRDGVIANFQAAQQLIRHFIRKVCGRMLVNPRIVASVPTCVTAVERRAVRESAEEAGVRQVHMIEEVMAAAIGAGIPVAEPQGQLVVNMGGGNSEAALVSLGGIVVSRSTPVAGDAMDDAIALHFRRKHNLIIGEATAESVKVRIGSVFPTGEEAVMEVRGRDQALGLPRTVQAVSREIQQVLLEPARQIVTMIREVLEAAPAQLAADLVDRGVVLTGGGSLLLGFPELLKQETGLPVIRAEEPMNCVALGAGKYLETLD